MSREVHRKAALRIWLAVAGAATIAAPGWGASRERADLYLQVNARGAACVFLRFDSQPPRSLPLEQAIGQALGGTLRDVERDAEEDEWTLDARCDNAFRRRGWLVEGQVDPDPLLRQLRAWSEQPSPLAVAPSSLPELGAPAVGGVTSVSPRTLINGRAHASN